MRKNSLKNWAISLFGVALIAALSLTLVGCEASEPKEDTYSIGESVETESAIVTIDRAEFAIALDNTVSDNLGLPIEYDPVMDRKNPYTASIGETIVSVTFTIENRDRNPLDLESDLFDEEIEGFLGVKYKDVLYPASWEAGQNPVEYLYSSTVPTDRPEATPTIDSETTKWANIEVGRTTTFRCYFIIPVEVDSLDDSFELIVNVPAPNETRTPFVYEINNA